MRRRKVVGIGLWWVKSPSPRKEKGQLTSVLLPALYGFLTMLLTPLVQRLVIATTGLDHFTGVRVLVSLHRALRAAASR